MLASTSSSVYGSSRSENPAPSRNASSHSTLRKLMKSAPGSTAGLRKTVSR